MKLLSKQILTNSEYKELIINNKNEDNLGLLSTIQTNKNEQKIFDKISNFELSLLERYQLVNTQNLSPIKLFLIISNITVRFSNDQLSSILY